MYNLLFSEELNEVVHVYSPLSSEELNEVVHACV